VDHLWEVMGRFREHTTASGAFAARRRQQAREWLRALIDEQLRAAFYDRPAVRAALPGIEAAVMDGEMPATAAARRLLALFGSEPVAPPEDPGDA
jgi:LAO/AO transport system kinase